MRETDARAKHGEVAGMIGIYAYLATGLVAASMAFAGAWNIQSWRCDAKEKVRVEEQITVERDARILDNKRISGVVAAQNAARVREVDLRAAADRSRAALGGMQASTDAALRSAAADHSACTVTAAALGSILNQCTGRYQALGEAADRHVSDIRTLTDAPQ